MAGAGIDKGIELIEPDWPVPDTVGAVASCRPGGASAGRFESLNVGAHVGDDSEKVSQNRRALLAAANCSGPGLWLDQVHGSTVVEADTVTSSPCTADGAVTGRRGQTCIVMTADCLPILLCNRAGTRIGALHAGWRGLAAGIVARGVQAMQSERLIAWLGPGISAARYEVGDDLRRAMLDRVPDCAAAFSANSRGRWQCDLTAIARLLLAEHDVAVFGGGICTATDPQRFFSHRRDGPCGRQATMIWLK